MVEDAIVLAQKANWLIQVNELCDIDIYKNGRRFEEGYYRIKELGAQSSLGDVEQNYLGKSNVAENKNFHGIIENFKIYSLNFTNREIQDMQGAGQPPQ